MFFLGVDGGGTNTEFVIINQYGKVMGYTKEETCHYKQTSLENFRRIITKGISRVCEKVNVPVSKIQYSVLGIPGYGEIEEDTLIIDEIIEEILKTNRYEIVNDAIVAWAGSLGCRPGINIVAGTGTIGYGVDSSGNYARVGGWGHHCGDEGSAHWIGKKVIELFTKQSDGRMEKSQLYNIVKSKLKLKKDFDLLAMLIDTYRMERTKIASLSLLMYRAAEEGDVFAKEVFSRAAYEHYLIIKSLVEKLEFSQGGKILVSYSGGVFNSGNYILFPLKKYINELDQRLELTKPLLSPVLGGALYAYIQANKDLDMPKEIIENLILFEESKNRESKDRN